MSSIRRFALAISGLVGVTAYGVVGYMFLGYTFLDALYQTCMTMTTVGYGEVHPPTTGMKIFSTSLMIMGVGIAPVSYTHLTLPTSDLV